MIKKARTRSKLFLQVKERLPDRDFQNQEEEQDFCSHAQVIPTETK
jgi:hypothetical protein